MRDQFIGGERFAWRQNNAGHHQFAPLWIGYAEDRRFTDRRMLVNDSFDLTAINVIAARNDHVLQAIQDVEVASRILVTDVSRPKQPISKIRFRFIWTIPISSRDV